MSKRRSTQDRKCPHCRIHVRLCFCERLVPTPNTIPVTIIQHIRERFLPTNTAHLAKITLQNCHIFMRGFQHEEGQINEASLTNRLSSQSENDFAEKRTNLYLYPSDDALEINDDFFEKHPGPYHLIVPDGSWRQCKKFHRRDKTLEGLLRVKITPKVASQYFLRKQHLDEGLCTFEAIMMALGALEKNQQNNELMTSMEANFSIMVKRFLQARHNFHGEILS